MQRKFKFLYSLLLLCSFIPKVYAFTYDMSIDIEKTSVSVGTETEIDISLSNVLETSKGIEFCSLDILFDDTIELISRIEVADNWNISTGKKYTFKAVSGVDDKDMRFTIPVKINDSGFVRLVDIVCYDDNTEVFLNDKHVSFVVAEDDKTQEENEDYLYNYDLLDVKFNEGTIDFNKDITKYDMKVTDFEDLEIFPEVGEDVKAYNISKLSDENGNRVIISMNSDSDSGDLLKKYTINVSETINEDIKKDNTYIPIFILVLLVLILINLIRIIRNRKRK